MRIMDLNMAEPGEILPDRKIDTSAYDLLQTTRTSVEDIVTQMLSIKNEGGDSTKSQLPELVTQMLLHFVNLRKANRSILLEEDLVKAETEHAKAPVDFTTLQLHNLMYEKNHYVKAIKACKDFKSKYPDIELVSEEEFFNDAPEQIKNSVQSNDSAHNLMLKRLNFELFQRKELAKLHEKLEEQKKILQDTIANRKKFLSSLPSHLKSLKKASLPVQNQLGILHTKKLKQHQSAELLPPPLFVIYSQLLAHKEAFGEGIDLEIVGSLKDAHTFARQQANKDNGISTANTENSKLEDDVVDEEDDGQRRRKRPKKVQAKESLDPARIYQTHPLKLILQIHDDEASDPKSTKLIALKFEYLLKLNVVCVGIEGSNEGPESNILCNLFPNDPGLELPLQSAKLWSGDGPVFDEKRSSRPYKWAQHLAGIDFLPEVSPLLTAGAESTNSETTKQTAIVSGLSVYRQQNRVQTVVQRIRARKKAQLALAEQIDSLTKLKWPSLTCQTIPWFSHARVCNLQSWTIMPSHKSTAPVEEQIQSQQEVDMVGGEPDTSKAEIENLREDGELPSLNAAATAANEITVTPLKISSIEHSKRLSLISKSVASPMSKGKSPSSRRLDEEFDLMLSDSEVDEPPQAEPETLGGEGIKGIDNSWITCGVRDYCLILTRKVNTGDGFMKLEAKITVSMEYPLRPPLFTLNLFRAASTETESEAEVNEWFNELRAMEAEVNIHVMKTIPWEEEKFVLGHQICCLAMLFDFYVIGDSATEKGSNTCVVDVGLCKPVTGGLVSRTYRGRDHRKMISWKDDGCTPGYPS